MATMKSNLIDIDFDNGLAIVSFNQPSIGVSGGVESISQKLREFVDSNKPAKMLVDFSGVKFFSSQTLGVLIDMWRKLQAYDGKMAICGINPQLYRVFRITNLDKIFAFHETKEDAINELA